MKVGRVERVTDYDTSAAQSAIELRTHSAAALEAAAEERGVPLSALADGPALLATVRAEAEPEFEAALVSGLCREGALELFDAAAARAARRLLSEVLATPRA